MKLNEKSLNWSLNHCETEDPFTTTFPKPFEFNVIREYWDEIKDKILNIKFPKQWKIRDARKIFAPKHQFGFRLCTQLDPIDQIIYNAIVYELGEDLEKFRIKKDQNMRRKF